MHDIRVFIDLCSGRSPSDMGTFSERLCGVLRCRGCGSIVRKSRKQPRTECGNCLCEWPDAIRYRPLVRGKCAILGVALMCGSVIGVSAPLLRERQLDHGETVMESCVPTAYLIWRLDCLDADNLQRLMNRLCDPCVGSGSFYLYGPNKKQYYQSAVYKKVFQDKFGDVNGEQPVELCKQQVVVPLVRPLSALHDHLLRDSLRQIVEGDKRQWAQDMLCYQLGQRLRAINGEALEPPFPQDPQALFEMWRWWLNHGNISQQKMALFILLMDFPNKVVQLSRQESCPEWLVWDWLVYDADVGGHLFASGREVVPFDPIALMCWSRHLDDRMRLSLIEHADLEWLDNEQEIDWICSFWLSEVSREAALSLFYECSWVERSGFGQDKNSGVDIEQSFDWFFDLNCDVAIEALWESGDDGMVSAMLLWLQAHPEEWLCVEPDEKEQP